MALDILVKKLSRVFFRPFVSFSFDDPQGNPARDILPAFVLFYNKKSPLLQEESFHIITVKKLLFIEKILEVLVIHHFFLKNICTAFG